MDAALIQLTRLPNLSHLALDVMHINSFYLWYPIYEEEIKSFATNKIQGNYSLAVRDVLVREFVH